MWLRMILTEMNVKITTPTTIYVDNQSAKRISDNDAEHDRTKHIDIKYRFIKQAVDDGIIMLSWISNEHQLADILTKGLGANLFTRFRNKLMSTF